MDDLISILSELLQTGTLKINIQISLERTIQEKGSFPAVCGDCGWSRVYDTEDQAKRALRSHHQHCTALADIPDWLKPQEDTSSTDPGEG